jgi:hypothetical protein
MKPLDLYVNTAYFFGLPFAIAAAFRYTDWLGWPALVVGGVLWLGSVCVLAQGLKK